MTIDLQDAILDVPEWPTVDGPADAVPLRLVAAPAVTASSTDPLSVLVSKFAQYQPTVVVVVDEHMLPCGYVTPTRVMAAAAGHGRQSLQPLLVADVMNREFVMLDGATTIGEAAQVLVDRNQGWVAVCERDVLLGVVYAKRLLHLLWRPLVGRVLPRARRRAW
jgi:CBS-domain-containing membrane protein